MAERSELAIQTLFRSRARIQCPAVSIIAIPNAGKRGMGAARQAKREGMASGFPDVLCFWKGPGIAAIEFKAAKGKLSENQAEWLDRLTSLGIPATVSRDRTMRWSSCAGLGHRFWMMRGLLARSSSRSWTTFSGGWGWNHERSDPSPP